MIKLMLANIDYKRHTTDEGEQLQSGLEQAGWILAGHGYGDGTTEVDYLLERYQPDAVLVADKRDFDPQSGCCFNPKTEFKRLEALADPKWKHVYKIATVKDAGGAKEYHRAFAEQINADALLTYYHEKSVLAQIPWAADYDLIRTYHTVDKDLCTRIIARDGFMRPAKSIVTGATDPNIYPIRSMCFQNGDKLGLEVLPHPHHSNHGCHVSVYLETLRNYRVHVATASKFGFCVRKIIESVAMGCIPVTDLPTYDVLPGIDQILLRIPQNATLNNVHSAIHFAGGFWEQENVLRFSQLARKLYDYRRIGSGLDYLIEQAAIKFRSKQSKIIADDSYGHPITQESNQ